MAKQKGITQIAGLRSGGYAMNITSSIDKLKVNKIRKTASEDIRMEDRMKESDGR